MKKIIALFLCVACMTLTVAPTITAADVDVKPEATSPMNPKDDPGYKEITAPTYPKGIQYDDTKAKAKIDEANPVDQSFLKKVNDFAAKSSVKVLRRQTDNYTYSPLSAYMALSMAGVGAKSTTQSEILSMLGVEKQGAAYLAKQNANLFRHMYTDNDIGKLTIANSLWLKEEMTFKDSYLNTAKQDFYASLFHVDFTKEAAGEQMGKWIAKNTGNTLAPKIKTNRDQVMSIINTVYFKDQWLHNFDKANTKPDTFYLADGKKVTTDFMNKVISSHGFRKGDDFTASALRMKNGGEMTFILPDEGVTPSDLMETPQKINELLTGGAVKNGMVTFQIPKFSFETDIDLKKSLKALGMTSAFKDTANFGGITDEKIFISDVKQQTHIAIDENGVEASAFTMIDFATSSLPLDSAAMIMNRPFIFTITSREGAVLFMGVINNPLQK